MLRAGLAKAEITAWEPGLLLLGWGQYDNVAEGVAEPLFARALVLEDAARNERVAYVCVDLCFVTQSVRDAVLAALTREDAALGLTARSVMLTATHTHSGPSGYAHEVYYTLMTGGFVPRVHAAIVAGIVRAIREAAARMETARLRVAAGAMPGPAIAFNRALGPYLRNRGARHVPRDRPALGVDPTHTVLRIEDAAGRPLGALSTFPLHGTCVHADHRVIHPDHKGLAAERLDAIARARLGAGPDFVAIFAQGAAGDVTPNGRASPSRGVHVGPSDDDFESARCIAEAQAAHAAALLVQAADEPPLEPVLAAACVHAQLADAPVDDDLLDGLRPGARTTGAVIGLAMAHGTHEGHGPLHAQRRATYALARLRRAAGLDPKVPLLEVDRGDDTRAFGLVATRALAETAAHIDAVRADPTVARYLGWARTGTLGAAPWVATVAPVQVVRIGRLALAGIPGEPTLTAGARLRHTLLGALAPLGVRGAIVQGYANAYTGYVTTPEEYAYQHYEGGYTVFGPRTLAAHRTALRRAAHRLVSPPRDADRDVVPGPAPHACPPELLAARSRNRDAAGAPATTPEGGPDAPPITDLLDSLRSLR